MAFESLKKMLNPDDEENLEYDDVVETSKSSTFLSEAQSLYKYSKNVYVLDKQKGYNYVYTNDPTVVGVNTKMLDVSSRQGFYYTIRFNADGAMVEFKVRDNDHSIDISNSSGIKLKDINKNAVRTIE